MKTEMLDGVCGVHWRRAANIKHRDAYEGSNDNEKMDRMGHRKERLDENRDKCVAVTSSGKLACCEVFLLLYYLDSSPLRVIPWLQLLKREYL